MGVLLLSSSRRLGRKLKLRGEENVCRSRWSQPLFVSLQLQKRKEREEQLEDVIQAYEKIHMEKSNLQRDLDKMVRDATQLAATLVFDSPRSHTDKTNNNNNNNNTCDL